MALRIQQDAHVGLEEALAGFEESPVVLDPSHPDYLPLFFEDPEGTQPKKPEDALLALKATLESHPGEKVVLRFVPTTLAQEKVWRDELGLRPLLDPNGFHLPPSATVLSQEINDKEIPYALEWKAESPTRTMRLFSPEGNPLTQQERGFSWGFEKNIQALREGGQPKDWNSFQSQVRGYLRDNPPRLAYLGIPLGLPAAQDKKAFCGEWDLPHNLLSEEELGDYQQDQRARQKALDLQEEKEREGRKRQELRDSLVFLEPEIRQAQERLRQRLFSVSAYLDPDSAQGIAAGIEGLTLDQVVEGIAAQIVSPEAAAEPARAFVAEQEKHLQEAIEDLEAQPVSPNGLGPVVKHLAKQFPELAEGEGLLDEVFTNPHVQKRGWTPVRLARFLERLREIGAFLNEKLPAFPWFSEVILEVNPESTELISTTLRGAPEDEKRIEKTFLILNVDDPNYSAKQMLQEAPLLIFQTVAMTMLFSAPAVRFSVSLAELSEQGRIVQVGRDQMKLILEGFVGHPWLAGTPLPAEFIRDPHLLKMWGEGVKIGHGSTLTDLVSERVALLLGEERFSISRDLRRKVLLRLQDMHREVRKREGIESLDRAHHKALQGDSRRQTKAIEGMATLEEASQHLYRNQHRLEIRKWAQRVLSRQATDLIWLSALADARVLLEEEQDASLLSEISRMEEEALTDLDWLRERFAGRVTLIDPELQIHWRPLYQKTVEAYRTVFNGIHLRQNAGPSTPRQSSEQALLRAGLEERPSEMGRRDFVKTATAAANLVFGGNLGALSPVQLQEIGVSKEELFSITELLKLYQTLSLSAPQTHNRTTYKHITDALVKLRGEVDGIAQRLEPEHPLARLVSEEEQRFRDVLNPLSAVPSEEAFAPATGAEGLLVLLNDPARYDLWLKVRFLTDDLRRYYGAASITRAEEFARAKAAQSLDAYLRDAFARYVEPVVRSAFAKAAQQLQTRDGVVADVDIVVRHYLDLFAAKELGQGFSGLDPAAKAFSLKFHGSQDSINDVVADWVGEQRVAAWRAAKLTVDAKIREQFGEHAWLSAESSHLGNLLQGKETVAEALAEHEQASLSRSRSGQRQWLLGRRRAQIHEILDGRRFQGERIHRTDEGRNLSKLEGLSNEELVELDVDAYALEIAQRYPPDEPSKRTQPSAREMAVARDTAVAAWGRVPETIPRPPESQVLVFRDPATFDLVPLALRRGWTVAVDSDEPAAVSLRALLDELRQRGLISGTYAIGSRGTAFLLEGAEPFEVTPDNRPQLLALLGLRPNDLPPAVPYALEITRTFLDLSA